MSNAEDKLNEATFFLDHMIESPFQRTDFRYYLSAFLSAFRSVDYFMCHEMKDDSAFKVWRHELKKSIHENDPVMELLIDKRNLSVHQEPFQPLMSAFITFTEPLLFASSAFRGPVRSADGTVLQEAVTMLPDKEVDSEVTQRYEWYFREFPEQDVVSVCTHALIRLGSIVQEYEDRFLQT